VAENEEDRITTSKVLGEGILPWPKIIEGLQQIEYDGWLSLEYERRWAPNDLPDADIGMRKSVTYLKSILNDCVELAI
jgi:L-ribulose-5-phosphate 3-epimerase